MLSDPKVDGLLAPRKQTGHHIFVIYSDYTALAEMLRSIDTREDVIATLVQGKSCYSFGGSACFQGIVLFRSFWPVVLRVSPRSLLALPKVRLS